MNKSPEVIICFMALERQRGIEKRVNKLENEIHTCGLEMDDAKEILIDSLSENEYGRSHIFEFDNYFFVMLYNNGDYIMQVVEK